MIEQDLGIANSLDEQKKQGAGFNFEERGFWYLSEAGCCVLPTVGRVWHICPAGLIFVRQDGRPVTVTAAASSCRWSMPDQCAGRDFKTLPAGILPPVL